MPPQSRAAEPKADRSGRFVTLASGFDNDDDALPIRARARVLGATLKVGETVEYALGERRHGYLVPASGAVEVNGVRIDARDGAAIKDVAVVRITAISASTLNTIFGMASEGCGTDFAAGDSLGHLSVSVRIG